MFSQTLSRHFAMRCIDLHGTYELSLYRLLDMIDSCCWWVKLQELSRFTIPELSSRKQQEDDYEQEHGHDKGSFTLVSGKAHRML